MKELYTAIVYKDWESTVIPCCTLMEIRDMKVAEHFEAADFWDYLGMSHEELLEEPITEDFILHVLKYDYLYAELIKEN